MNRLRTCRRFAVRAASAVLPLLGLGLGAAAAFANPPAGSTAVAQAPEPAPRADPSRFPEPHVQQTVLEDESVRIEELRVRGLNTRLVVKPRHAAAYEVVPTPGGRDPSQGRLGSQGAAGQRVWNVLKF